ncbi:MAG: HAD-IIA family hydrolase [Actinomycetota bacterium]|nr:HAD-IIA family hydrolase [Actinomycetota bacterium]
MAEAKAAVNRYFNFLFDMDGVIYLNMQPIPEAVGFLERLRGMDRKILFLTNNSKYTRSEYREKLAGMGVESTEEEILTSAAAAAGFLVEEYEPEGSTAFMIGGTGLKEELSRTGLRLLEGEDGVEAEYVVVGWDTGLTYEKLRVACLALHAGAHFIGTNPDATFPSPEGLWPGAGSIIAALERAAGRDAIVVGKPNMYMMRAALSMVGGRADATLMVGDRLETDILGGWRAGMDTCLVLTGVSGRKELEGYSPQPDIIVDSLLELL